MARKRHSPEEIIGKLREAEVLISQGRSVAEATLSQLEEICALEADPPVIVLAHWGEDYVGSPGQFERQALNVLANCGVSAIIGAHSHQASTVVEQRLGGALQSVFSMGNFIFDQTGPNVSGSLVELRVFRQGTIALRIIRIPNFFEMDERSGSG